jgi:hypothetical protein
MTDQPTPTDQERPARLSSEDRAWLVRYHTTGNLTCAMTGQPMCDEDEHLWPCAALNALAEIDALRQECDTWKARAERLISDAADIQRYWQDEGVRGDGFCFSLNCLLRDAGLEEPLDALAEPQPPAEPATADHPWFAWLPPTASVHRNCCDRPQSEHPPGEIVSTLDQAGAALVEAGDAMVDEIGMLIQGGIEVKPASDGPVTFEAMIHMLQMMTLHRDAWRRARGLDGEGE